MLEQRLLSDTAEDIAILGIAGLLRQMLSLDFNGQESLYELQDCWFLLEDHINCSKKVDQQYLAFFTELAERVATRFALHLM